ncbi:unnamed protein product [Blepharisma stoltei]|uniref:Transcription factor 25 n=1 Tax=Blepharisma stoltei TaxID=1481888 RepID=A0AAU9JLZ8_9CILI|nr:unnamed protein product [Blepharisma stoltei]
MSLRQVRKILESQKSTENLDSENSSEEEIMAQPSNKFSDFVIISSSESEENEFESIDHEEEKLPVTKIAAPRKKEEIVTGDVDSLLEELKTIKSVDDAFHMQSTVSCLKRQAKHFDPRPELALLFPEENKGQRDSHVTQRKMILTPDKQNWPTNINYLLEMERCPDSSRHIFNFKPSKGYSKLHSQYMDSLIGNDLNAVNDFLKTYPFHIEGLYQLSIALQMRGNYNDLENLLERILYSFQLSFHHQFSPIGNGLELDIAANTYNRIFYKSLYMYAECLGRKGCVKAALEFVKFILSLNPHDDPLGCLLLIDYYSIKAKRLDYFLRFADSFMQEFYGTGNLLMMPNILYSFALCKALRDRYLEITSEDIERAKAIGNLSELTGENSSVALIIAIICYPNIAKSLLKRLVPSFVPTEDKREPGILGDYQKIADIHAARVEELWRQEYIINWLKNGLLSASFLIGTKDDLISDRNFEGIFNRYNSLELADFSNVPRLVAPPEFQIGREENHQNGNLDPNANPFYLFFATLLPWNFVNFAN